MSHPYNTCVFVWLLCFVSASPSLGRSVELQSPDGKVRVDVTDDGQIAYSVTRDGRTIIAPSPIRMSFQVANLPPQEYRILSTSRQSVDEILEPVVPLKRQHIDDQYHELRVQLANMSQSLSVPTTRGCLSLEYDLSRLRDCDSRAGLVPLSRRRPGLVCS